MTTPVYSAGDMIEATLTFTSTAQTPVQEVTAYYGRHEGPDDDRSFEEKEATEKDLVERYSLTRILHRR
jgi:hypothetical protein